MSKPSHKKSVILTLAQLAFLLGMIQPVHAGGPSDPRQGTWNPKTPPGIDDASGDGYYGTPDGTQYGRKPGGSASDGYDDPGSYQDPGKGGKYASDPDQRGYGSDPNDYRYPAAPPPLPRINWNYPRYPQDSRSDNVADDLNRSELQRVQAQYPRTPYYPRAPHENLPPYAGDSSGSDYGSYKGGDYGKNTQSSDPDYAPAPPISKGGDKGYGSDPGKGYSSDPYGDGNYDGGDYGKGYGSDPGGKLPPKYGKPIASDPQGKQDPVQDPVQRHRAKTPSEPVEEPIEAPNPASAGNVATHGRSTEHGWDFFPQHYYFGLVTNKGSVPQKKARLSQLQRSLGNVIQSIYGSPHSAVDANGQEIQLNGQGYCQATRQGTHLVSSFFGAKKIIFVDGNFVRVRDTAATETAAAAAACGLSAMSSGTATTASCPTRAPAAGGTLIDLRKEGGGVVSGDTLYLKTDLASMRKVVGNTLLKSRGLAKCVGEVSSVSGSAAANRVPGLPDDSGPGTGTSGSGTAGGLQ